MDSLKLLAAMGKLLKLHRSLRELADKKTDIVKKGDMDALTQLLKEEQAHITAISKLESERQNLAAAIVPAVDKPSVSDCLTVLHGEEKIMLEQMRSELVEIVFQIQQKNELNQQLIYQSLQFVNLSLDLIAPQPEEFNYGPPAGRVNEPGRSPGMFNSKA
ncbi:flagellar protein FlgN [Neobacillus sp. PS3-34]|uniref:flagellar protein FlgN n=1 Tax=Neobacillus sp. PS3-34 TaxID=3070678 RepID=UPI0027DF7A31|nr:flagellar protein FlgN [Neobacillus sp. PS3-34]WML46885.1 flagellar protein FlgN [Neobacillus sp. PS3-34]